MLAVTDVKQLQGPLIRLNSRHIRKFAHPRELAVEGERYLRGGCYEAGTRLIDVAGTAVKVTSVTKKRRSLSWKYWGAPEPVWVVGLGLASEGQVSIEVLKRLLIDLVISNRWHRSAHYSSDEEFESEIGSARTILDLFAHLSFFGRLT